MMYSLSMKIVFILASSADHDEMPPYTGFHLCLYYLPKGLFLQFLERQIKSILEYGNMDDSMLILYGKEVISIS